MPTTWCILLGGIPAAGKTTLARLLSETLRIPVLSKDQEKEALFDRQGFTSRAEKVRLGDIAAENIYAQAELLMAEGKPFILENNFERKDRPRLAAMLAARNCLPVSLILTGDHRVIYNRFVRRNLSPERHPGHVVNDFYPRKDPLTQAQRRAATPSFAAYCAGIAARGMEEQATEGPCLHLDMTDPNALDAQSVVRWIRAHIDASEGGCPR